MDDLNSFLARVAADPQRPTYHFMPPANWMNDPNGPIYYKGRYHLFYQHNPYDATWGGRSGTPLYHNPHAASTGTMHWGHAVSADLVNWTHLPIALAPTPGGPDKDGCFSGCAVVHNGVPSLLYTGVDPQVQCLATSHDDLLIWHKDPRNPVLAGPPPGWTLPDFRDPCVWREAGEWRMLIGTGVPNGGGAALHYRSPDLVHWDFVHPLCVGDREHSGHIWECPDFFPLGDKWVLLVSPIPLGKTIYFIGSYRDGRFEHETQGTVDFGDYYAAKSFEDAQGQRILWGWSWEARSETAQREAGWAGVMSLPRVLTLGKDRRLGMKPAPELQHLRHLHRIAHNVAVSNVAPPLFPEICGSGAALEILAQFSRTDARQYGLKVRCSPGGEEQTSILYDSADHRLIVDRSRSSLHSDAKHDVQSGPFALDTDETLTLHLFLDHSILEVYANGRACLTSRIYPIRDDSSLVLPYADDGKAVLEHINVWTLLPAKFEMMIR